MRMFVWTNPRQQMVFTIQYWLLPSISLRSACTCWARWPAVVLGMLDFAGDAWGAESMQTTLTGDVKGFYNL